MSEKDPTLTRNVLELVTISSEFCNLLESCSSLNKADLLKSLQSFIPLLYLRGTLIHDIQPTDPESAERFVTEEQWEIIFLALRKILGNDDEFFMLENQMENSEGIKLSIAENLSDAYQDIKDFVTLYRKNSLSSRENAIHDIKHLFETNWGNKLSNLLPIIHSLNSKTIVESTSDSNLFDLDD